MLGKWTSLISVVLVVGLVLPNLAYAVHPTPVAWWKLDGDALDSSGNDLNGTLHGNPQWVPGIYGDALEFDGDDYVTIDGYKGIVTDGTNTSAFTITAWIRAASDGEIIGWGSSGDGNRAEFRVDDGRLRYESGGGNVQADTTVSDNTWHHAAVTIPANAQYVDVTIYLDGKDDTQPENDTDVVHPLSNFDAIMGQRYNREGRWYTGVIDDLRIYDVVLTLEEIQEAMAGIGPISPLAFEPVPENESTDVPRDVVLSWTPGEYAAAVNGHKLYISENFNDVNNGIGGIIQDANSYTPPQLLDFGKTYYWRVDEVAAPPDSTIVEGEVWQFTVEPFAYPIVGDNIITTASSNEEGKGPENTINGSGLDESGLLHSNDSVGNMWLSSADGTQPTWIEYEFDRVYKLHEMWVWNSNDSLEDLIGFGFKEVIIEYSANGTDFATLGTTHEFAKALGKPDYAHDITIDFGGVAAKHIRLIANSNWGGIFNQFGLSEVRFFSIPVFARTPNPAPGATDVDVDVILSWKAGREAATHEVYLSTDEQAVIDGTAKVATETQTTHGPLNLDLGTTYYWRVDEVNEAETPTTWQGDFWNLSTQEYLVVDDFESYNDIPVGEEGSNLVYVVWKDGFDNPSVNGSTIGYTEAFQPSMETLIFNDGKQSVPIFYDNTVAAYSEVTVNVTDLQASRDWSKHGIKALTLQFYGDPNNSVNDQMYVKLNGSKFTYDGDAGNLQRIGWQTWYIDLASFSVNLSNITDLSIGFERIGAVGGQGVVLLDGIRLYSYDPQLITPTDPGTTGLQVHYEFEGTFNDSSGNSRHSVGMGNPTFMAGKVGQGINLRGLNDYLEITGYKGVLGANAFSITTWVKTMYMGEDPQEIVYYGTHDSGQRCEFRVHTDGHIRMGNGAGQVESLTAVTDGGWHHVAATIKENATNSSSDLRIYVDGQDNTMESIDPDVFNIVADWDVTIGYRPSLSDRFFMGQIDDVRIYDRTLSQEEIAWLAGRTKSFDKPF
jgi:hypothetical protein